MAHNGSQFRYLVLLAQRVHGISKSLGKLFYNVERAAVIDLSCQSRLKFMSLSPSFLSIVSGRVARMCDGSERGGE